MKLSKSARVSQRRRGANQPVRTRVRNLVARARRLAASSDEGAPAAIAVASAYLDHAALRGVVHPNTAARTKSRLARHVSPST